MRAGAVGVVLGRRRCWWSDWPVVWGSGYLCLGVTGEGRGGAEGRMWVIQGACENCGSVERTEERKGRPAWWSDAVLRKEMKRWWVIWGKFWMLNLDIQRSIIVVSSILAWPLHMRYTFYAMKQHFILFNHFKVLLPKKQPSIHLKSSFKIPVYTTNHTHLWQCFQPWNIRSLKNVFRNILAH